MKEEAAIDALRLKAFETNSDADRQAYFDAVSKWFQDRHIRRMDAERSTFLPVQGASAARELALEEAEHAVGSTVLKHRASDYEGMDSLEAYEAGQLNGLERAQASLRAISSPNHADADTLETYYARQIEWSKNTFGPALRTKGIIDHIKKELKEIEAEPHDLSEWIDVVILAMDGFWRHGGSVDDLMPRLLAKQQKNMARTWPDWRTMSEEQAIEHDRSQDADAGKVDGDRWQPIESAPKDGTIVLLGWNDPDINEIGAVAGWYENGPADNYWYDQYHEPVTATHWMPLRPLPPAPASEGGE
ncbi:dATP/dGTP pyrophosphohydrolase domain-containing protein [Brucella vulpis]|uniref:dATP/dGTP pyrophosphohydrolase domain-containing protein n=1 Tax=Brucella vulpis TaxID=981386 RepID=UPI004032F997